MALEEKRSWVVLGTAGGGYLAYLVLVLGRGGPLAERDYVAPLLWTAGAAVVLAIVLSVGVMAGERTVDERDREIQRFGDYIGQSFVAIGGVAALVMAMAEVRHFWIANAVYLMFALSATVGAVARIFAYRRGFQW